MSIFRKLKATWTQEAADDLHAIHNIDTEGELSAMLAAEINKEIDRETISDIIHSASGTPSRKNKQYRSIDDPWEV